MQLECAIENLWKLWEKCFIVCFATAPSFKTVQKEVAEILQGRVLVGHAVKNDLKVR